MLAGNKAFNSFAVDDLDSAKEFYEETLGLKLTMIEELGLLQLEVGGGAPTMIYPRPDFTPATYTVLHFSVDDVEQTVDELGSRGVIFERYEGFDQDEKGIVRGDAPTGAWFKDPAGNILGIVEGGFSA